MAASQHLEASGSNKLTKTLKYSKSVENLSGRLDTPRQPLRSPLDQVRRPSNASVTSLPGIMSSSSKAPTAPPSKKRSTSAADNHNYPPLRHSSLDTSEQELHHFNHTQPPASPSRLPLPSSPIPPKVEDSSSVTQSRRRHPPPPKRRKPPAIPIGHTNSGATITSIKSSEPSPLSKVHKPQIGVPQVS